MLPSGPNRVFLKTWQCLIILYCGVRQNNVLSPQAPWLILGLHGIIKQSFQRSDKIVFSPKLDYKKSACPRKKNLAINFTAIPQRFGTEHHIHDTCPQVCLNHLQRPVTSRWWARKPSVKRPLLLSSLPKMSTQSMKMTSAIRVQLSLLVLMWLFICCLFEMTLTIP